MVVCVVVAILVAGQKQNLHSTIDVKIFFLMLKIPIFFFFFFSNLRIYRLKDFTDFENKQYFFQNCFTNGFCSPPLYCKDMYGVVVQTKSNRYLHKYGN